jgi:NADH:ubiquinone oxidoreductase subunit 5 (subunit L)/multisubunit Na+/H+ antiporter MnhA subunit
MKAIVGYSPNKSQNMVLVGNLRKHAPIVKTAFLIGTPSFALFHPLLVFVPRMRFLIFFFGLKIKDIHSFKSVEYIRFK